MAGSTASRRLRSAAVVAAGALAIAVVTALVFVIRAGGDPADAATWPITWELRSSDNGTLFQVFQDLAAGRPLDWSFSPQVYVFPELPLSAIAFAVSGGSIYAYYLVVAALANALLFLALVALARVMSPAGTVDGAVVRASVAAIPLVLLPLIGTSWILSFHLAPTYYLGMYAALIVAPVVVLARSRALRIVLAVALALTAASNPLALLFAAPGTAIALVLLVIRRGWRAALPPVLSVGSLLAGTLVLRLLLSPLQGTSPFTYVDAEVFAGRLSAIGPYFAYQARDPAAGVVLAMGLVLAVLCLAASVVAAAMWLRRGSADPDRRLLAVVMLGLVPLGGLLATYLLMITHYYYFWPVLILPYVLVLLVVPRAIAPAVLAGGGVALVVVAFATGLTTNLGGWDRYDGYRGDETVCLDRAVPGAVGYATFSDARRLSLPSATGVRLIPIVASGEPNTWLANRATSRTEAGSFFYLNGSGDELVIDESALVDRFGEPDQIAECSEWQRVLIYDDPQKLQRVADWYVTEPTG